MRFRSAFILSVISSITVGLIQARAEVSASSDVGVERDRCSSRENCRDETREVNFNLMCNYDFGHHLVVNDDGHYARSCTVSATFRKNVTMDGGEVQDDSNDMNNPQMQVECDGSVIFGPSGARRFTDLLGTRIQGQTGPTPAILLPRAALHSGAEGQSGSHYSESTLEVRAPSGLERARGSCFIWSGNP